MCCPPGTEARCWENLWQVERPLSLVPHQPFAPQRRASRGRSMRAEIGVAVRMPAQKPAGPSADHLSRDKGDPATCESQRTQAPPLPTRETLIQLGQDFLTATTPGPEASERLLIAA